MRFPRSRLVAFGIVALLLLVFFVYAFAPRAIPVDLAEADRGPVLVTVDEEAKTRVHERYTVSAPITGRLLRVEVEPGDAVTEGETVVVRFVPAASNPLDPRTETQAEAAVDAAEAALQLSVAEVEGARADLRLAERTHQRYKDLVEEDIAAEAAFDQAERDLRAARARLKSASANVNMRRADVSQAKAMLIDVQATKDDAMVGNPYPAESVPVLAPISGKVLRIVQESEVTISAGHPILEVGDPVGDLEVEAELLSTEAVKVELGDRVLIERWGGDGVLEGTVARIEPWAFTKVSALGIEEQRVRAIVDFAVAPEARRGLGDGFRVYVRIVVDDAEGVVRVPSNALFEEDGETFVFVVEGARVRRRQVDVGLDNGLLAEIRSGVEEGARVVLYPSDNVVDRVRVRAR